MMSRLSALQRERRQTQTEVTSSFSSFQRFSLNRHVGVGMDPAELSVQQRVLMQCIAFTIQS